MIDELLPPKQRRKPRIGLVAGGLGTYWPQFPHLLPQLQESARYVSQRFQEMDAEVTDVGFISDAQEGVVAAEKLRQADCDLIVLFLTTYLTSSMVLPIAQRANTPVLVIDLQPTEKMDHADVRHRRPGSRTAGSARCPRSATCSGGPASSSGRSPAGCGRSPPGSGSASGSGPHTCGPRCGTPGTA